MSEFTLEPAELAFLLTLVNATTIPGLDLTPLFPQDDAERTVILERGSAALQAHGYMRVENGYIEDMPTVLPLAVAVLAAPEQLLLTTFPSEAGMVQMGHYLAEELVVEFYQTPDELYHLVALATVETALARIAATLDAEQPSSRPSVTYDVAAERIDPLSNSVEYLAPALEAVPLAAEEARQLGIAIQVEGQQASVVVSQAIDDVIAIYSVLTLVALRDIVVLIHQSSEGGTTLTVPAGAAFMDALHADVKAVQLPVLATP